MKSILIFSNGEKIGDGIIKLPLLNEIKRRLPNHRLYWMTDHGNTVYTTTLKEIASKFIYKCFEKADFNYFFSRKISNKFDLEKENFDIIFDTQKSIFRTLTLKKIKHKTFISGSASGFFSDTKLPKLIKNQRKYYLENLYDLLDLIVKKEVDKNFNFPINQNIEEKLKKIFNMNCKYVGIAPGAGEKNKIWPIENYIAVCNYLESKGFMLVFYLGPDEKEVQEIFKTNFKRAFFLEENKLLINFQNIEIIMASTKFLKFALSNDSGVSHMLSTNYCPLIKLFGPKDFKKFTPKKNKLITISAEDFYSNKIEDIKVSKVIEVIDNLINNYD
ncbi:hypothetical protein N9W05_04250 [Alphaproteobacteria bacterium]|nr:hypothetical protein [Alphaproteobacteria bacterium]